MNSNYSHDPAYMPQSSPTSDYDDLVAEIQRLDAASEQQGMKALFAFVFAVGFGVWMLIIDRPISLVIAAFGIGVGIWLMRDGAALSLEADELRAQLPATPPTAHTEFVTLPDGRVIPRERYEDILSRNPHTQGQAPTGNASGPVAGTHSSFDDLGDEEGF